MTACERVDANDLAPKAETDKLFTLLAKEVERMTGLHTDAQKQTVDLLNAKLKSMEVMIAHW